jgi:hypothetical protein
MPITRKSADDIHAMNRGDLMSMQYIRKTYAVPAKRGAEIVYYGGGCDLVGVITGSSGALHPTWCVRYLMPEKEAG